VFIATFYGPTFQQLLLYLHFAATLGVVVRHNLVQSPRLLSNQNLRHAGLFLPRDAMLSTVCAVVVCLSVCVGECVSVTLQYCIKMAKCRITQIMPYDSPGTLVF